jgi:hypothetical protein
VFRPLSSTKLNEYEWICELSSTRRYKESISGEQRQYLQAERNEKGYGIP